MVISPRQTSIFTVNDSLDENHIEVWHSYLETSLRVIEKLDHSLQQFSHISLTDYEILATLANQPEEKIRMSDLANKIFISRSRLTYRIDRLVNVEYVSREECTKDRRGFWAKLTDTGKEKYNESEPNYIRDIENLFIFQLDEEEIKTLKNITKRINSKLKSS